MSTEKDLKVALIQFLVLKDRDANIRKSVELIEKAKENSADIVILPEFFNGEIGTGYSEEIPTGIISQALSKCAQKNEIFVVGGSIPEIDEKVMYNTSAVYNNDGVLVAKHRKMHLFDVDIQGKLTVKESDKITAGNSYTTFEINNYKVGLGVCYDARFAELGSIYQREGCCLLIYPSFFSITTGSLHWSLVMRSRALENQLYVAGVNRARDDAAEIKSFGHSMFVNPLGEIESEAGINEEIFYGYVDLKKMEQIRQNLPTIKHKRSDLYDVTYERL